MDEAGAELESLDPDKPAPKKPAEKPVTEVRPPEGIDKPKDKPAEKPADKPAEDAPIPTKAAELREAYTNLKKEVRESLRPALQKAEARIKELESAKPQDLTPIQEKLTATEKRNAELESHIQYLDYAKSKEFHDKYETPFLEAWQRAVSDFSQLTVRVPTGETDEVSGEAKFTTRPATDKDLLSLANMPLSEMDAAAEEMFGRSAPRVIRHVEKVRDLSDAQNKALEDAKSNASKQAEARKLETAAQAQTRQKLWQESNTQLAAKYPNWFAPAEDDAEGNALLEKGFALADKLFAPTAETAPKTPEETVRLHAIIRNKVANHDRLALRLRNTLAELKEAKATIEQYEKSEPRGGIGGGDGRTQGFTDPTEDANAEIDKLDVN